MLTVLMALIKLNYANSKYNSRELTMPKFTKSSRRLTKTASIKALTGIKKRFSNCMEHKLYLQIGLVQSVINSKKR